MQRDDFVSRLIDRAPTQELKDRIAELAMHDFGDADLEEGLEKRIKLIQEREDRKVLDRIKAFYKLAVDTGGKEKIEWCRKAIAELMQPPSINLHPKDAAKRLKGKS